MTSPNMETPQDTKMHFPIRAAQDDVSTELYAAGFNAWNQLTFDRSTIAQNNEADDIFTFTKVLGGQSLGPLEPELYFTHVRCGLHGCLAGASYINADCSGLVNTTSMAENGTGTVLSHSMTHGLLSQYKSMDDLIDDRPVKAWPWRSPITRVVSYDVGFVMLQEDGTVFTMGDPRFSHCLGRDVSKSSPADEPGEVTDLTALGEPIKRIAAGGYNAAALTESGALYIWGALPTKSQGRHHVFPDISRIPNYVEVDGDKDVKDIGLGESHAIALTSDHCVYVVGANNNGQLGLGGDISDKLDTWTKVDFPLRQGWQIVTIAAGPRSSFIMTSRINSG